MKLIIDIVLLVIIALCTWGGYKKGVVGGVAGILLIIVSLFAGALFSNAYSSEAIPAFRPFVSGYMDSQDNRSEILEKIGYGDTDRSLTDILNADPSLRYDYAYECMQKLGFYDTQSEQLAIEVVQLADSRGMTISDAVVQVQCETITYVMGLTIGFLLTLIIISAIGNLLNLSFRLPNMETLDEIGGAVLGFIKALFYCALLSWVLSFLGLLIGKETLEGTTLARFFLAFKFITGFLL